MTADAHTSAYVDLLAEASELFLELAYVSIREHTSAYVDLLAEALELILELAYVSIREHTSIR